MLNIVNKPLSGKPQHHKTVHVIFKTHLDIGYTDLARNVELKFFNEFLPAAIKLARMFREQGSANRFVWTTGSWLICEYLEQASKTDRRIFEKAIADSDINWHAMPFTVHSELMDRSLFEFGLNLSAELDRRFGHKTIAAKMSDIPGHTCAIIPALAKFGIKFLHIGTNGVSRHPVVPRLFVWKHGRHEILTAYDFGFYGGTLAVKGIEDILVFAHTLDNRPPQTLEQVNLFYEQLRRDYPGADIKASSLDEFAKAVLPIKHTLPIITEEIGDTWIHGVGTDPQKIAFFRQAQRLRVKWLKKYKDAVSLRKLDKFSRKLIMIPEHTWGLSSVKNPDDYKNYARNDFNNLRKTGFFDKYEHTWSEQREYLKEACNFLKKSKMFDELRIAWKQLEPCEPDLRDYRPLEAGQDVGTGSFTVVFNKHGCITKLATADGIVLADQKSPLALFSYEKFSQNDYDRFVKQYLVNVDIHSKWGIPAFTRPGIEPWAGKHKRYLPQADWIRYKETLRTVDFRIKMSMPQEAVELYGSPRRVYLDIMVSKQKPTIEFIIQWFDKSANRMPEAMWFSFLPALAEKGSWLLTKIGHDISPSDVVKNGNRHLHCTECVKLKMSKASIRIINLDTPLVAIGKLCLLNFGDYPKTSFKGVHFNLYNNIWNTNFPRWYSHDGISRYLLEVS